MKIGIVGLGLIGGSLAKAYKKNSDHVILGYDKAPPWSNLHEFTERSILLWTKTT